jgi:putative nucleotidyltransferase with HDIG domain
MKETFPESSGRKPDHESLIDKLWRWFIAPSPHVQERDQRRQTALISAMLLGIIGAGGIIEIITVASINIPGYTGYRQTIAALSVIAIIYGISRTRYIQLASILTVIATMSAIFVTGWAQPYGVLGGLFDYLILPLWLGSLYLSLRGLAYLTIIELIGLLVFPLLVSQVTLNDILVGPFSFIFVMFILLIVLTRHRNLLEQDRRAELLEKEELSRHEAFRTKALLRVAGKLNAQLDLDTLLDVLSEETAQALNTPVSIVSLYQRNLDALVPVKGKGLSQEQLENIPPYSKSSYDQTSKNLGAVFALPDMLSIPSATYLEAIKKLNFRSLATATMEYEHKLIGSLVVVSYGEPRNFTEDELFLLKGLADQAALAIINTRLYKDARRRLEHLQALRAIDIAISSNHNLQETLDVLLEQITKQLQVDAAVIILLDETRGQLEFGASLGFQTSTLRYTSLRVGEGMAGGAAQRREITHVQDLRTDPKSLVNAPLLAKEGFVSYYAAPLITQGQVKGVLEIFHRSLLNPNNEWLGFLETLAGQAAIAIESTTLFENLQRTNDELSKAYDSTIEGWSHALDLRDKETEGHTRRVTQLTLELARTFGFNESELVHIRRGALLHDIGKMGVPDRILLKEGSLTDDEWVIMRKHPVSAHEMLRPIQYLRPALDIPYCHHEKWDGTGYPRGLKGENIPLVARIFSIVDVWDALISARPYRAAWSHEKALAYIQEGKSSHFDPQIVEAFIKLLNEQMTYRS